MGIQTNHQAAFILYNELVFYENSSAFTVNLDGTGFSG